jgi:hypothetical protein
MATITGMTSAAMALIANASIVSARLVGTNLVLTTRGGTDINVGNVQGIQGIQGPVWVPNAGGVQTATDSWDTILTQGLHPNLVLGSQPQGPGTPVYYYVTNYTYGGSGGNRTQVAIPYSSTDVYPIVMRSRYAGVWSVWSLSTPVQARLKMTKTTVGHNAAGSAYTADTWNRLSGTTLTYATGMSADTATGIVTVGTAGNYDILYQNRFQSYGSVYDRTIAIVKGSVQPDATGSNVLGSVLVSSSGWLVLQANAQDIPLLATDTVTFWIRSTTGSTMNAASTAVAGWTFATLTRRS